MMPDLQLLANSLSFLQDPVSFLIVVGEGLAILTITFSPVSWGEGNVDRHQLMASSELPDMEVMHVFHTADPSEPSSEFVHFGSAFGVFGEEGLWGGLEEDVDGDTDDLGRGEEHND